MKLLDEVSAIGAIVGIYLGIVIATCYPVDPDFGFRGLLFFTMTGIGFGLIVGSGRIAWKSLFHLMDLMLFGVAAIGGTLLCILVQRFALTLPYLSTMATGARQIYLAEAAISETYLFFGLQAFFSERFSWHIGVPIPALMAYGTHQFVYGTSPQRLWAVVASFAMQAIIYEWSGRLSVPLAIHLVINLI